MQITLEKLIDAAQLILDLHKERVTEAKRLNAFKDKDAELCKEIDNLLKEADSLNVAWEMVMMIARGAAQSP